MFKCLKVPNSKTVCVPLCFYYRALHVVSCLALCSRVVLPSIMITSLGEERAGLHLLVYFARVNFCLSSLPLGVSDWLRFMIVALPRIFY